MPHLWFWKFWHWSAEGTIAGILLRGPLHGIAGHWDEWFQHEATTDDLAAIAFVSARPKRQRAFVTWVVRHWVPNASWKSERPSARFVLGQLAHLAPFDEWVTLAAFRNGYGVAGVSAIVLAEGSDGEAADVRRTEALAIPRDTLAEPARVEAEGFTATPQQLDAPRAAVESLLAGGGSWKLLAAWLVAGRRPFPIAVRVMLGAAWLILCSLVVALLVGPDPGDALVPAVAIIAGLWISLLIVDLSAAVVVAVQVLRDGQQVRARLDARDVRVHMPGGLRLIGGSAGLPFALNVLLAAYRAAPATAVRGWLWQRIFRALRTDASRWAATGGIDATGRVLPVVLEPKLRAVVQSRAVSHVLMPIQPGASPRMPTIETDTHVRAEELQQRLDRRHTRTPIGFASDANGVTVTHRCRHLANAVLDIAGVSSGTQRIMTSIAVAVSLVMLAAAPDIRAILSPSPAPMVVGPFSSSPYELWVSLDGARPEDFWIVLESGFWSNRRGKVQDPAERGSGAPRAVLPLRRAAFQNSPSVDDGTVWVERRRRFLFREFDPGERVGQFSLSYLMGRHG